MVGRQVRVRILNSRVLNLSTTVRGIRDSLHDADLLSAVGSWVRFLLAGRPPGKVSSTDIELYRLCWSGAEQVSGKPASD
jgi:hypothetical protein